MRTEENDILGSAFTALKIYKSKYIYAVLSAVSVSRPALFLRSGGLTKEDLYLHTLCKE